MKFFSEPENLENIFLKIIMFLGAYNECYRHWYKNYYSTSQQINTLVLLSVNN